MTMGKMIRLDPGRDSSHPPTQHVIQWALGTYCKGSGESLKLTIYFPLFLRSRTYRVFLSLNYVNLHGMVLRTWGQIYFYLKFILMAVSSYSLNSEKNLYNGNNKG
jgi:hypothetical protein